MQIDDLMKGISGTNVTLDGLKTVQNAHTGDIEDLRHTCSETLCHIASHITQCDSLENHRSSEDNQSQLLTDIHTTMEQLYAAVRTTPAPTTTIPADLTTTLDTLQTASQTNATADQEVYDYNAFSYNFVHLFNHTVRAAFSAVRYGDSS